MNITLTNQDIRNTVINAVNAQFEPAGLHVGSLEFVAAAEKHGGVRATVTLTPIGNQTPTGSPAD